MNKIFYIPLGLIMSSLFLLCGNNQVESKRASFKSCVIRIMSPFGCYQEIVLTNYGSGVFKQGLHDGDIRVQNVVIDSLYRIDSFKIDIEKDIKQINAAITSMMSDTVKGSYKYDAYRFQVFINEVPNIDVYGNTVKINDVLKMLLNHLPYAKNYCEFFRLMKEKYPNKK